MLFDNRTKEFGVHLEIVCARGCSCCSHDVLFLLFLNSGAGNKKGPDYSGPMFLVFAVLAVVVLLVLFHDEGNATGNNLTILAQNVQVVPTIAKP